LNCFLFGRLAVIYQSFFDESGTHDGSPIMTIGSYTFLKRSASKFAFEWRRKLKQHGLSHAHMTDCATGNGEYKSMTKEQRLRTEIDLIHLIHAHSLFGTGISIDKSYFEKANRGKQHVYGPYTMLLLLTVEKIILAMRERDPSAKIAYFFESGHLSASEANAFMDSIGRFGGSAADNYAGHAFVDKHTSLQLHAADMIAWQVRHFLIRKSQGHDAPRKDFVALGRKQDTFTEVSTQQIDWFVSLVEKVDPLKTRGPFELLQRVQDYVAVSGGLYKYGYHLTVATP
jgi:hypothetical protein